MARAPDGKKILNTHISEEEHLFLKKMAEKNAMTITMYLRELIRAEMSKVNKDTRYRGISHLRSSFR